MFHRSFSRGLAVLILSAATAVVGRAEPLPAPEGPVLLTVTGAITHAGPDGAARFDRAMLEALGLREITTSTIWTEGVSTFEGVSLDVLLDRLGATGSTISAQALNDYAVSVPVSDATPDGPIVAVLQDGAPMSRRDKGPLWLIYPYDSASKFRTEVIYTRSIWQLDRMTIAE